MNTACAFQHRASDHHSMDRVTVHHGTPEPLVLCGYHASPGWLSRVLDWYARTH